MTSMTSEVPHDPIFGAMEAVGDAWSWMILQEAMFHGTTRFNDFQQRLGIARKVLANRLDILTRSELFDRRALKGGGATLEYVLTARGWDFFPCLAVAMRWGERWFGEAAPPVHALHREPQHPFRAVLCCAHCAKPIQAHDVSVVSMHRASSALIGAKRQRTPDLDLLDQSAANPMVSTLRFVGDRWSALVIRECFLGTRRFGEFAEHLGIAPNILTSRLDRLVTLGALVKRPYQTNPIRYEYRLTEMGFDLYAVPLAMLTWGERWLSPGRQGTHLRHNPCGRPLVAILTCETCGEPATGADVAYSTDPAGTVGTGGVTGAQ
ncbi:winged helix-turn-helix transcriptional regulator [Oleomonas cavernae]|nr:helix-turn-helix domain-containing protein [Oleomonas cavernae]